MRGKLTSAIMSDPRNLAWCYEQELGWKRGRLKERHWYIHELANNGPRARQICGVAFVDLCQQFSKAHGCVPTMLDVGCGPVTSFAFLAHEGLAKIVGIDPLASRYATLLSDFDLRSPAEQLNGAGEWLDGVIPETSFDIVATRNALDHHQCPPLAWLRMFEHTKVGGFLGQSHSIREATKEGWKQLHQYDLYPDDDHTHLQLSDGEGRRICLTSTLPLEKVLATARHNEDGTGWFTSLYKKTDAVVPADYYASVLEHAAYSLAKRHEWALHLETVFQDWSGRIPFFRA